MRTTISINDAILKELHERAAASGRPFRQVVEESLEIGLAHLSNPPDRERFRLRPHPLGLKAGFRGVSLNQLYDQIEAEDDIREP
ncbi:MAG TPA: hypothetical protein VFJ58_07840 [Armatimonadota bacterium]|nr:hypothetical protein [Armatimonadota bacterium]